jgi:hypothetical protein
MNEGIQKERALLAALLEDMPLGALPPVDLSGLGSR